MRKPKLFTRSDIESNIVKFPAIVKPRTFAASRGVCVVRNQEKLLKTIYNKTLDYNRDSSDTIDDIEVEEFIDADIYHIDDLVHKVDILFCVTSKYTGSCCNSEFGEVLSSITVESALQVNALDFAKKVNNDLNIPDGAFH
ncbi:MAG: hypothetical protein ACK5NF_07015 [Bacilli bacterium]